MRIGDLHFHGTALWNGPVVTPGPNVAARRLPMRNLSFLLTLALLPACSGCYDAERLIQHARADVQTSQLVEVDLGSYRTAMPRVPGTAINTEVHFRVFANVPHYRQEDISAKIEELGYVLRYKTLAAVRQTTPAELDDPDLDAFRQRIEKVTVDLLGKDAIESIGLAEIDIVQY